MKPVPALLKRLLARPVAQRRMLAELDGIGWWCSPKSDGRPPELFTGRLEPSFEHAWVGVGMVFWPDDPLTLISVIANLGWEVRFIRQNWEARRFYTEEWDSFNNLYEITAVAMESAT